MIYMLHDPIYTMLPYCFSSGKMKSCRTFFPSQTSQCSRHFNPEMNRGQRGLNPGPYAHDGPILLPELCIVPYTKRALNMSVGTFDESTYPYIYTHIKAIYMYMSMFTCMYMYVHAYMYM